MGPQQSHEPCYKTPSSIIKFQERLQQTSASGLRDVAWVPGGLPEQPRVQHHRDGQLRAARHVLRALRGGLRAGPSS